MDQQPHPSVTEFRVVIMAKFTDGRDVVYKSPGYKVPGAEGLGPHLLAVVMNKRLRDWIAEMMKS